VNVIGATNTMAQIAAIAAFEDCSFIEEYNRKHDKRRKFAYELFNSISRSKYDYARIRFLLLDQHF